MMDVEATWTDKFNKEWSLNVVNIKAIFGTTGTPASNYGENGIDGFKLIESGRLGTVTRSKP
jgi:hypothetical protein